jgi:hypothetical protein
MGMLHMNFSNSQVMALELEQGLTKNPLRLESLESKGKNKPASTKREPKLADVSNETAEAKARNGSGTFPSMADEPNNKLSPNLPSFSFSPNISVRTQYFFHVCQECFSGDLRCHFMFPNIQHVLLVHQKAVKNDLMWCCHFLRNISTMYTNCTHSQEKH